MLRTLTDCVCASTERNNVLQHLLKQTPVQFVSYLSTYQGGIISPHLAGTHCANTKFESERRSAEAPTAVKCSVGLSVWSRPRTALQCACAKLW